MTAHARLGRVLVVWAVIVPLLALACGRNFNRDWGWWAGLAQITIDVGPFDLPFTAILIPALLALGLGLTLWPGERPGQGAAK